MLPKAFLLSVRTQNLSGHREDRKNCKSSPAVFYPGSAYEPQLSLLTSISGGPGTGPPAENAQLSSFCIPVPGDDRSGPAQRGLRGSPEYSFTLPEEKENGRLIEIPAHCGEIGPI